MSKATKSEQVLSKPGSKVVVVKAKEELAKKAHQVGLKAAKKAPAGADPEVAHAMYENARDEELQRAGKKPLVQALKEGKAKVAADDKQEKKQQAKAQTPAKPEAKKDAPKSRIRGVETDGVAKWINSWLDKNPDGKAGGALKAFREAGKSCAQNRFNATFRTVVTARAKGKKAA